MKGALVGFGVIAQGHLAAYHAVDGLDVTCVVNASPERLAVARVRGLDGFPDLDSCIAAHPDLEFLDICTPPASHAHFMMRALDRGLDLLCEKPVFLTTSDGFNTLWERVLRTPNTVYPVHNYRFAPVVRRMFDVVRDPDFGDVVEAHLRTIRVGHARGAPEWHPDWRRDPAVSAGGILRDHGPHSLYMLELMMGRPPTEISCVAGSLRPRPDQTEDTVLMRLRYPGGATAAIDLTWAGTERSTRYVLVGSRGSVSVDDDQLRVTLAGRGWTETMVSDFNDPSHTAWYRDVLGDFLRARASPAYRSELLSQARRNGDAIAAGYESMARDGGWVTLPVPAERADQ